MLVERLQLITETLTASWVADLRLQVTDAAPGDVSFRLTVRPELVHAGGVLCGQAIMAGFDTGMVLVMASLDAERTFTTVTLTTSFERAVPADAGVVTFHARATKRGRTLVFGEVSCSLPDGARAAAASSTYMWL